MRTAFIYGLRCPLTGQIRYIGKCDDPKARLRGHLKDPKKNHRTNWIASLKSQGLKPALEVIAEVADDNWQFWERSYIRAYHQLGFDLVNGSDGGEGGRLTFETRAKISAARLGKKMSTETKQKLRFAHAGRKHSEEMRAKCRVAKGGKNHHFFGKKFSPEFCAKLSASRSTSGFTGIFKHKLTGKWQAYRGRVYLGIFSRIEDAIFVRALAIDKHYGNC